MKTKIVLFALLLAGYFTGETQVFSASNFTLIGKIDPETGVNNDGDKYSGCWGWYQASKNKEYAIACGQAGTYWVDVTNPATPTVSAYRAGAHSACTWREAKTYQNYCYVISDDSGVNSFQIFDMQYLPDSVHKVYDSTDLFKRAHTLWVDGNKLYVAAVTSNSNTLTNMNVYSLATPTAPVLLRSLSQDYSFINRVHDMYVRNDTCFASCEYQGMYVFKLTAANTFTQLGSITAYTASGYNHSSAWTPNGKTLVMLDEVPNALPIKVLDVTNLSNMQVVSTMRQFSGTTHHNPYIVNNQFCFVSSYADGLQLYDISSPATPSLAGYFDTYPQGGGNIGSWTGSAYVGQWGCYPFFPSKNIFALDQLNGIFMLKTNFYSNTPNTTAIPENISPSEMSVFPNPASDHLTFSLPAEEINNDISVNIINMQGQVSASFSGKEIEKQGLYYRSIGLPVLAEGLYFLQVSSNGRMINHKKLLITN